MVYNAPSTVSYMDETVGEYLADLVVEAKLIIEVKAVAALSVAHTAQLVNYLRISSMRLGFLFNFSPARLEVTRKVV